MITTLMAIHTYSAQISQERYDMKKINDRQVIREIINQCSPNNNSAKTENNNNKTNKQTTTKYMIVSKPLPWKTMPWLNLFPDCKERDGFLLS